MTTHNKAILGGFLQTVVAFFVCGPVSGEALSDEFAKVTGQIVLGDRWKKLPPIVEAGATDIKDAEICGARGIPNERLVVDEESLGVSNVFVWLSRPKISDSVRERIENKKMPPVPWTFDGCRLVPHVQCVRAGQTLQVINRDSTAHSPHDYPLKNTVGCALMPPGTTEEAGKLEQSYHRAESLPIIFKCDYHAWIVGYLLVQDHPWMTVTDDKGRFTLADVPVGTHKLVAWHELRGYLLRKDINIKSPSTMIEKVTLNLTGDEKEQLEISNL